MCYFEDISRNKWEKYIQELSEYLKSNLIKYNKEGYMIGLSGGMDSAVSAALAVHAVGESRVKCMILPDQDSDSRTVNDAKKVANHLGIKNVKIENITKKLSIFGAYSLFKEFYRIPKNQRTEYIKNQNLSPKYRRAYGN